MISGDSPSQEEEDAGGDGTTRLQSVRPRSGAQAEARLYKVTQTHRVGTEVQRCKGGIIKCIEDWWVGMDSDTLSLTQVISLDRWQWQIMPPCYHLCLIDLILSWWCPKCEMIVSELWNTSNLEIEDLILMRLTWYYYWWCDVSASERCVSITTLLSVCYDYGVVCF